MPQDKFNPTFSMPDFSNELDSFLQGGDEVERTMISMGAAIQKLERSVLPLANSDAEREEMKQNIRDLLALPQQVIEYNRACQLLLESAVTTIRILSARIESLEHNPYG